MKKSYMFVGVGFCVNKVGQVINFKVRGIFFLITIYEIFQSQDYFKNLA